MLVQTLFGILGLVGVVWDRKNLPCFCFKMKEAANRSPWIWWIHLSTKSRTNQTVTNEQCCQTKMLSGPTNQVQKCPPKHHKCYQILIKIAGKRIAETNIKSCQAVEVDQHHWCPNCGTPTCVFPCDPAELTSQSNISSYWQKCILPRVINGLGNHHGSRRKSSLCSFPLFFM